MPRAKISAIIDAINTAKGLHLTEAEMKNFYANPTAYIGAPFAYLKPLLDKDAEASKYPAFQGVIIALKKNEQFKFQLVTDPVQPPPGTQLARERGI